jgi:alkylation response protein AidB-like acyl-CoA dehydrogenase
VVAEYKGVPTLVSVHPSDAQRIAVPEGVIDPSRVLTALPFDGTDAQLLTTGPCWSSVARSLDLARLALAAECLGGAARLLDVSVAYADAREQHGRRLREFQAVSHRCAEIALETECMRGLVYRAALDADEERLEEFAHSSLVAKVYCASAYTRVAKHAIQVQGAIGLTAENLVPAFYLRAFANEDRFGDRETDRRRLARLAHAHVAAQSA